MARVKVWIEAMEEYLVRHNLCERDKLENLSDDDLSKLYYSIVKEKGL